MSPRLDFTIVLPVYYNEESLLPAYEKLKAIILAQQPRLRGGLLYVDDGSGDGSFGVLQQIHAQGEIPVSVVKLSRNFGQVMAIRAGIAHCEAAAAIVMSADGQEPADLIPQMLAEHFENVGHNLEGAVKSYNTAVGSLEARVLVTARKFKELGAATEKEVPAASQLDLTPRAVQAPELTAPPEAGAQTSALPTS